jgi:hypothetical protein
MHPSSPSHPPFCQIMQRTSQTGTSLKVCKIQVVCVNVTNEKKSVLTIVEKLQHQCSSFNFLIFLIAHKLNSLLKSHFLPKKHVIVLMSPSNY